MNIIKKIAFVILSVLSCYLSYTFISNMQTSNTNLRPSPMPTFLPTPAPTPSQYDAPIFSYDFNDDFDD